MKRVVVLIQVRMKSTRLRRKALCLIEDKPLIEHIIERLKRAETPDEIVICTSSHPDDKILVEMAERNGVGWFMGSEEDVLHRFIQAAERFEAEVVVRASGEDSLVDPIYLDNAVREHLKKGVEYTSVKDLPPGVGVEVIDKKALKKAYELADNPDKSEYITLYFKEDFFKVHSVEVEEELKRPQYCLTVDTPEDLKLMRKIYKTLYKSGGTIPVRSVIRLLDERPELVQINKHRMPRRVRREVLVRGGKPKIRIIEE